MQNESENKAPQGQLFYIVTDPVGPRRSYLYHVRHENRRLAKGSYFAPFRQGSRAWDDEWLAGSMCRFISEVEGRQLNVVLEPGIRKET